nr:HD domain-containing phosphohydrolase [Massilia agilis]
MRWYAHQPRRLGQAVLAAVVALFLFGIVPAAAHSAPEPAAPRQAAVVVAVPVNFPPWVIPDQAGGVTGILKDLWTLWGERNDISVTLLPLPFDQLQEAVASGQADIGDALIRTPSREARFDFSAPHFETQVMLYFSQELTGIVDAATARGFVVGVAQGDACGEKLAAQGDTLKRYPNHQAMIAAAVKGDIRLFCAQQPVADYFLNRLRKTDAFRHSPPLYSARAHWVVRKGNEALYRQVSQGFDNISAQEREAIDKRWYGTRIEPSALPIYLRYAGYILLALGVGGALLAAWNRSLRQQVTAKTAELESMLANLVCAQKSLDDTNAALRQTLNQTVGALTSAMAHRDLSTAGHERRITELAVAIGRELGFDEHRLEGLGIAAMIHDVGQIQVPAEILTRPRRLSPEEFDLVKLHAQAGRDILRDIQFPWPIAEIVYQHHENVDGSGYPRGLVGDQILPEARIIRVADSVEAMLSHRPFRRAASIDSVIAQLRAGKGLQYDADVVNACVRLIERDWQWLARPAGGADEKLLTHP